ncbi:MAG: hypothetical protein NTU79_10770 [Planctomycetota bacterium]|nr:hypothetical protein [Planctomycetota bacterium]
MLDRYQLSHYRVVAERDFLKFGATEFQGWFGRIMSAAFVSDYVNVRISKGDGGIDGYQLSTGKVFQVYGPRVGSDSSTTTKIREDFETATTTMRQGGLELKGWVFLHNDPQDISHEVALTIAALQKANPGVTIHRWAFDAIWDVIKQLSLDKLEALFGFTSPTAASMDRLEFAALVLIIEFLERAPIPANADLTKPSVKKLDYNALSVERRTIIETGNRKSGLVFEYLDGMPDPQVGEQIAQAFRVRYRSLREAGMAPDRIFDALWEAGGGKHFTEPLQIDAVSAILAYYFHSCDIFENAPV